MDCLDRTNVVQATIARAVLENLVDLFIYFVVNFQFVNLVFFLLQRKCFSL